MSFALSTAASPGPQVLAGVQTGPTTITAYDESDLFSTAIPAVLGTNLLSTPVTLDPLFLGIHTKAADARQYPPGWNRSHDQAPRWNTMNPAQGVYVDAGMGAWLDACLASGQQPVFTLFGTPTWASARPAEGGDPYGIPGAIAEPASMAHLYAFVVWLVTNYPQIKFLEIWNEWKGMVGNGSYGSMTAAKLAEMTRTIVQAARSVRSDIKFIGWGCTGALFTGAGSGIDYTAQLLAASDGAGGTGKDWIDILSFHTYAHDGANDITKLADTKGFVTTLKANAGISSKPTWSTEFGFITPDFSVYTGPESGRANALLRYCLWHVVAGFDRINHYPLGWSPTPERVQLWTRIAETLNGAQVTCINRVANSQALACVINGRRYLV